MDETSRRRLDRWRESYQPSPALGFDRRLADVGIHESALLALLAESPDCLAARVVQPDWVNTVERTIGSAGPPSGTDMPPSTDWREAFAVPLRSFVDNATARLVEQAGQALDTRHADLPAIAEGFSAHLTRRLTRIAVRTLVHMLDEQRERDRPPGGVTPEWMADFVRRQAEPAGLTRLVTTYPVLARMLGQACQFAVEATLELLARFADDRPAIVDTLLGQVDPGRLVAIESGAGDTHQHGRSVAIVSFADQRRAVYKPRDLGAHTCFASVVDWLNQAVPDLDLRIPAAVIRRRYGWLEFVPARPLAGPETADRFYRRQGGLLALLYALNAGDIHYENLIACGDQPVLIDVETLFHPTFPGNGDAADPASVALAASVQRTGLLPMLVLGENGALDVSGLGADAGQTASRKAVDWEWTAADGMRLTRRTVPFRGARNRPRLDERIVDPADYEVELLEGFRLGYEVITQHRPEFTALLESYADIEVRTIVRPTQGYVTLLDESTQPGLLGDALDRDQALDLLWTQAASYPFCWRVAKHELEDLWAGDVPTFHSRPGSTDLWSSNGHRLPGMLERSGLANALDKVAAMGAEDRQRQEWVISAALACRRSTGQHLSATPMPGDPAGTAATTDRLLAAACALADQVVARSMANDERTNWLSVELVEEQRWMVLPMGAGLANGYLGVALFLAQLAEISGIARYTDVARHTLSAIPRLYQTLTGRTDVVAAIGCGALHGFGGMAYALARIATLLADDDVRGWALSAVELAVTAAGAPGPPDLANGTAGCLATMTAVHAELGSDSAGRLAGACADRLAELASRTGGRCVAGADRLPTGFARGTAGIGWAMARHAATGGHPRHAAAARLVLDVALAGDPDAGSAGPGWCSGTAGRTVARLALADDLADDLADGGAEEALVRQLAGRPLLRDLSPCHGELGVAEALAMLAVAGRSGPAARASRRRAGLILGALSQNLLPHGALDSVPTPSLLTGAAGVGYGLLRLGFTEQVPSVLLFEPTRRLAKMHM